MGSFPETFTDPYVKPVSSRGLLYALAIPPTRIARVSTHLLLDQAYMFSY